MCVSHSRQCWRVSRSVSAHLRAGVSACMWVYFKKMNLSICARLCIFNGRAQLCVFVFMCVCTSCVYACVRYEQSVSFPAAEPTNHVPPSSLFITYSWVSVSAGRWLALNEQLTALSVSQCYGNKISQPVQKKQQSTTGTETLFNRSSETVYPSGRLTYWILSTAWYLWYGSHNVSNLLVIKCAHFKTLWIITGKKKKRKHI